MCDGWIVNHFETMSQHKLRARHTLAYLGWMVPLVWIHHPAQSQTTVTLPTVTVTAGEAPRLEKPASTGSNLDLTPLQTPASLDVISREQLDARGDATLIDAITRATGISSMAHPGNSGSALSARGFTDSTSVMRLYDGTRQYGNVSPSFPFDTWSIDRIEVLRGPASVIYGDGAIGGVINVIPKKPTRGPIRHEVQATIGTRGKQALAYGSGGSINDMLSYRFDVSGDRSTAGSIAASQATRPSPAQYSSTFHPTCKSSSATRRASRTPCATPASP